MSCVPGVGTGWCLITTLPMRSTGWSHAIMTTSKRSLMTVRNVPLVNWVRWWEKSERHTYWERNSTLGLLCSLIILRSYWKRKETWMHYENWDRGQKDTKRKEKLKLIQTVRKKVAWAENRQNKRPRWDRCACRHMQAHNNLIIVNRNLFISRVVHKTAIREATETCRQPRGHQRTCTGHGESRKAPVECLWTILITQTDPPP